MTAALGAIVTGPVALWARKGRTQRPKLHRAFGYAWVTLMVVTAVSAMFIRDSSLPRCFGQRPPAISRATNAHAIFWSPSSRD